MKKSILETILALGIIKFTDIEEGFLCKIEADKIKNDVENAVMKFKQGIIDQIEFQKVIFRNQQKLDDVLVEWV
jgi:hypothetical protein